MNKTVSRKTLIALLFSFFLVPVSAFAQEFDFNGDMTTDHRDATIFRQEWVKKSIDAGAPFRLINEWQLTAKSTGKDTPRKAGRASQSDTKGLNGTIGVDLQPGSPIAFGDGPMVDDPDSDIDTTLSSPLFRGQRISTLVRLDGRDSFLGVRFDVAFDPAVLRLVSVVETPFDLDLNGEVTPDEVLYYSDLVGNVFQEEGPIPLLGFDVNSVVPGPITIDPRPFFDTLVVNQELGLGESILGKDLLGNVESGIGIPYWTFLSGVQGIGVESMDLFRPLGESNAQGVLKDTTVVLLPRPGVPRFNLGYDTSVSGPAILMGLVFEVRSNAAFGPTQIRVDNAGTLNENFTSPDALENVEGRPISILQIAPRPPDSDPAPRRVAIDLDRSTPEIDTFLPLPAFSPTPPPIQGAVIFEGTATDQVSYYAIQIGAFNLDTEQGGINFSAPVLLSASEIADATIGAATHVDELYFGRVNPFGAPTEVGSDGKLTLFTFDIQLDIRPGETVDLQARGFSSLDGLVVNGLPGRLDTGAADDLLAPISKVSFGAPSSPIEFPTQLRAVPGADSILLTWTPNGDNDGRGYHVYRADTDVGTSTRIASFVTEPRYVDPDLPVGEDFFYEVTAVGEDGQTESFPTFRSGAVAGQIIMNLPDLVAPLSGPPIHLRLGTLNSRGISDGSFEIQISYPSDLLVLQGVDTTALTQGFSLQTSSSFPGDLVIHATREGGSTLEGEGTLVDVIFSVTSTAVLGDEGFVTFGAVTLFDASGSLSPVNTADTGRIQIGTEGFLGDVNFDGVVDLADAEAAVGIALRGLNTPENVAAGDINGDGIVDAADVTLILRIIMELPLGPMASKSNPEKGGAGGSSEDFDVIIGKAVFDPRGSLKSVPVEVDLPAGSATGIAALQMQMNYDPDLVELVRVDPGDLTGGFDLFVDFTDLSQFFTPGVVKVIFSSFENQPPLKGTWCNIVFMDKMAAPDGTDSRVLPAVGKLKRQYGEDISWDGTVTSVEGQIIFGPEDTTPTPTATPTETLTPVPDTPTPTNTQEPDPPTATATATPVPDAPTPTNTVPSPTPTLTPLPTAPNPEFDVDGSGVIDAKDLLLFLINWQHQVP